MTPKAGESYAVFTLMRGLLCWDGRTWNISIHAAKLFGRRADAERVIERRRIHGATIRPCVLSFQEEV